MIIGVPVLLIRNLDIPSLRNGTRLQITHLSTKVVKATVTTDIGQNQLTDINSKDSNIDAVIKTEPYTVPDSNMDAVIKTESSSVPDSPMDAVIKTEPSSVPETSEEPIPEELSMELQTDPSAEGRLAILLLR
ncbi:hypothetical protein AVEN_136479-1 [Araneus ventricosus]|uniref:DNA helicase Pif1-like 2B domain-containing protein n=1 Tax=Araneus ventricosus TaxID=182803 RepID=A0A4Y2QFJ2_ARAVE|nr:hypothetical protein AVEN_136479-1 [Araneus ventricosus]